MEDNPMTFNQAKKSVNSCEWINFMKDEMKLMQNNDIWNLVKLFEGSKSIT